MAPLVRIAKEELIVSHMLEHSDAANAKVAELRTMVGERYRDLLAAADSIVRMRGAADKLLDRLEGVESAVMSAGDAIHGTLPFRFHMSFPVLIQSYSRSYTSTATVSHRTSIRFDQFSNPFFTPHPFPHPAPLPQPLFSRPLFDRTTQVPPRSSTRESRKSGLARIGRVQT